MRDKSSERRENTVDERTRVTLYGTISLEQRKNKHPSPYRGNITAATATKAIEGLTDQTPRITVTNLSTGHLTEEIYNHVCPNHRAARKPSLQRKLKRV